VHVPSDEPRRSNLRTSWRIEKSVGVVVLSGEADQFALHELRAAFDKAVSAAGWPLLVVDVTGLDFIDAAGLGALVAARKRLRQQGGALVICGESEAFQKITRITGLTQGFVTASSVYEARWRAIARSVFTDKQITRRRNPT
jgi:anti-sigma B factor antagonist